MAAHPAVGRVLDLSRINWRKCVAHQSSDHTLAAPSAGTSAGRFDTIGGIGGIFAQLGPIRASNYLPPVT